MPEKKRIQNPTMKLKEVDGFKILSEIHKRNRFSFINGLTEVTTIHQTQIKEEDKIKINKRCAFSPQTGKFTFSSTETYYSGNILKSVITRKINSTHDQDHKIINITRNSSTQFINKQIEPVLLPH